ncbi:MAG: DUF4174 domain-containing protein [Desulfobacterales bacterium]|jgi:bifunctional DNA-binding transcriptional regulator/antitoxin component of YhaV-PrlF toxin-antitoxin module
MSKTVFLTLAVAVLLSDFSQNAIAEPLDLRQFQWKNRLLFLFAPNRDHPMFVSLHNSLSAQQAEVDDRDLVIFIILESDPSSINTQSLASDSAFSLRKQYGVNPGEFAVLLVGKDGGIKLKRQDDIRLEEIFALIDAMPMRREEMRQKNRQNEDGAAVGKTTE